MARSYAANQEYQFRAGPRVVFRSLSEPNLLVKWFLSAAELEPRPGGSFAFDWSQGYHMDGKVLEFASPRRISFRWIDKLPDGRTVATRASFRVAKQGKGSILTLRHTGFHDPVHFAECSARWAYYLTNLKSVLDHRIDLRSPLDW